MNAAIIAAGGVGERFGAEGGKQLALASGETVLAHTLRAFEQSAAVDSVVVVTHPDRIDDTRRMAVDAIGATKVLAVVAGGSTRRASVAAGIAALPPNASLIGVHDGARAAVTAEVIDAAYATLAADARLDGVVVGHASVDTIKRVAADGLVAETPDRSGIWIAQTPQVFRADALRRAHARALAEGFEGTDDASLIERDGGIVAMVPGPRWNLKVTLPEDIAVLEAILALRGEVGQP